MNGYYTVVCSWILVRDEENAPEINVSKSARFNELRNTHFVGYNALPTCLLRHVTTWDNKAPRVYHGSTSHVPWKHHGGPIEAA